MTTTADRKLAWIKARIAERMTVCLTSATRSTRFTRPNQVETALRVRNGSLELMERGAWVSADYLKVSALDERLPKAAVSR